MGHHHTRQLILDQQPIGPQIRLHVDECTPIHRQRDVRIDHHGAVAGEMLGDRGHARLAHAREISRRQRGHRVGVAVKSPVADDLAHAVIEVDAGCEAEIHPHRVQLARHEPPDRMRKAQRLALVLIEAPAQQVHGGQRGEPLSEALYAAALVIHGDQQMRRAQRPYCGGQRGNLLRAAVVAAEQQDAAHQRMAQDLDIIGGELGSRDIDHERS